MARARLYRLAMVVFVVLGIAAAALAFLARGNPAPVIIGSLLMTGTLMMTVPAMSGNRVYLGVSAAAAVPIAVADALTAAAIYAISLTIAWLLYLIFRPIDLTELNSEYLAEVIAISGFGGTYHLVSMVH